MGLMTTDPAMISFATNAMAFATARSFAANAKPAVSPPPAPEQAAAPGVKSLGTAASIISLWEAALENATPRPRESVIAATVRENPKLHAAYLEGFGELSDDARRAHSRRMSDIIAARMASKSDSKKGAKQ